MSHNIILRSAEEITEGELRSLLGRTSTSGYIEKDTLGVTYFDGDDTVDVEPGIVHILHNWRDITVDTDAFTGHSLVSGGENTLWIVVDPSEPTENQAVSLVSNTTGVTPTNPHIEIAVVDTTKSGEDAVSPSNRGLGAALDGDDINPRSIGRMQAVQDATIQQANVANADIDTATIGALTIPGFNIARERIDVFAVGGQSNARGKGDASGSSDLPADVALDYRGNGEFQALSDPVGTGVNQADTGSAWPAFAERYYALTGNRVCLVHKPVGSSSQTAAAGDTDGNWSAQGTLREDLVNATNNALDALEAQGYDTRFRAILWSQGEADADAINDGTITASNYASALRGMVDYFNSNLPGRFTFGVFETGARRSGGSLGWKDIRQEQRLLTLDPDYPTAAYLSGIQRQFRSRSLMNPDSQVGELHYSQEGYNRMGIRGADSLVSGDTRPELTAVSASLGTDQEIPSAHEPTQLQLDTTEVGFGIQHKTTTGELVVEVDGKYLLSGMALWGSYIPAGTPVHVDILVNGTVITGSWGSPAEDPDSTMPTYSGNALPGVLKYLNHGDVVTMQATQESGSPRYVLSGDTNQFTHLSVTPATDRRGDR